MVDVLHVLYGVIHVWIACFQRIIHVWGHRRSGIIGKGGGGHVITSMCEMTHPKIIAAVAAAIRTVPVAPHATLY